MGSVTNDLSQRKSLAAMTILSGNGIPIGTLTYRFLFH